MSAYVDVSLITVLRHVSNGMMTSNDLEVRPPPPSARRSLDFMETKSSQSEFGSTGKCWVKEPLYRKGVPCNHPGYPRASDTICYAANYSLENDSVPARFFFSFQLEECEA